MTNLRGFEATAGASSSLRSTEPMRRPGEPSQISQAPTLCARTDRGEIAKLCALADDDVVLDHAGRADISLGADLDATDDQFIALDPRVGDVGDRADAGAGADRDEIDGAGIDFADDGVGANLRAERAQVKPHEGRALEPFDMDKADEAAGQPPAEVIDAP